MSKAHDALRKRLRPKKKDFPQELFKPINFGVDIYQSVPTKEQAELIHKIQLMSQMEKLWALLDHYEIKRDDPNAWLYLSYELATQLFTGLDLYQDRKKRQAPKKWDELYPKLYDDVQVHLHKKHSVKSACTILKKKESWSRYSVKTLQNRYKISVTKVKRSV